MILKVKNIYCIDTACEHLYRRCSKYAVKRGVNNARLHTILYLLMNILKFQIILWSKDRLCNADVLLQLFTENVNV
jgi:hypothetical protein